MNGSRSRPHSRGPPNGRDRGEQTADTPGYGPVPLERYTPHPRLVLACPQNFSEDERREAERAQRMQREYGSNQPPPYHQPPQHPHHYDGRYGYNDRHCQQPLHYPPPAAAFYPPPSSHYGPPPPHYGIHPPQYPPPPPGYHQLPPPPPPPYQHRPKYDCHSRSSRDYDRRQR